jgi:hypothetical protein
MYFVDTELLCIIRWLVYSGDVEIYPRLCFNIWYFHEHVHEVIRNTAKPQYIIDSPGPRSAMMHYPILDQKATRKS